MERQRPSGCSCRTDGRSVTVRSAQALLARPEYQSEQRLDQRLYFLAAAVCLCLLLGS